MEKHIYADSNEAMAEAKRDVKTGHVASRATSPASTWTGRSAPATALNYRGDDYYGYRVVFDIDVQVPYDTELVLKTVNRGDIVVKKTSGDYEINGLNGGIEMADVSGSGSVNTLNGKVNVTYTKNPAKATSFKTLNGSIDIYFRPG